MGKSTEAKDRATMEAIGEIYCAGNHDVEARGGQAMCPDCRTAIESTLQRALKCPHGHEHNCQDCTTQCQRGQAQQDIQRIMRYAAPRMAYRHPLMTFRYLRKKLRNRE